MALSDLRHDDLVKIKLLLLTNFSDEKTTEFLDRLARAENEPEAEKCDE